MADSVEKAKGNHDRYSIYSIEKAFDVIEALAAAGSLSLIEMTEQLQQPKSSLYRIVLTLEKRGYVTRSDGDGRYCLGYKNLLVTKRLLEQSDLRRASAPEMHRLVEKYGDTVNLGVLSEGDVVYMEIVEGTHALRMKDTVGSRAPVHATAIGKAIAAHLGEAEVRGLLSGARLEALTPKTTTDVDGYIEQLSQVREWGYAVDDEEMVEGARCIAAPIFDMQGRVAGAISMSGALHRFAPKQWPVIGADVQGAAKAISRSLGYGER